MNFRYFIYHKKKILFFWTRLYIRDYFGYGNDYRCTLEEAERYIELYKSKILDNLKAREDFKKDKNKTICCD